MGFLICFLRVDLTGLIAALSTEKANTEENRCFHLKQRTPSAQLQAMFARGWSYPTVLKAKSDQKIADLRLKTAGRLSSSTLLGYFIIRRQCRNIQKMHAAVDMHVKTETGRTKT